MKRIAALLLLACCSFTAAALPVPAPPTVDATSYALLDFQSGELIAGSNPDARVEPASITKVMTVYIAFDELKKGRLKLDDTALVSEKAWRQGIDSSESRMFIEVGTRVKIEDLLRGIIIASGNDASVALSEHIAGSEPVFAEMMNQYAKKLGLNNTHFADASGLPSPDHYTTARDLTLLGRALIRDFPDMYKIFAERSYQYSGAPKVKAQPNRNGLLEKDPSVDGIKTGHTNAAGYCLLASAQRDGRRLISAVMGAKTWAGRESASLELLNYGFRFYENVTLFGATQPLSTVRAWKGTEEQLPLGVQPALTLILPRGSRDQIQYVPQVTGQAVAPIKAGQPFGTVTITLDGKPLRTVPLVALKDIPEGGLLTRLIDSARMLINR
ncbi:MAG: D-alanyl-D-alanine carboxypeptidase [Nevskiaceae bacterium]|nr:MAG: D-alanyl-D-alanine carboxypeptidase [Nevskiaceae bacterium]